MNTPLSRLLLVALTVAAFVGLTTSASAAGDYWDPNKPQHIKLVAQPGSTLHVLDHETFGADEVITSDLTNTVFGKVTPWLNMTEATTTLSRCAGDEVRAELEISTYTWSYDVRINGTAKLRLYEGSDCNTTDLDGVSEEFFFSMFPKQITSLKIPVKNVAEGGDYAVATLKLKAVVGDGK